MIYNIWMECASLVFLMVLAMHLMMNQRFLSKISRRFEILTILSLINIIINLAGSIFISYPGIAKAWVVSLTNETYYYFNFLVSMAFLSCVLLIFEQHETKAGRWLMTINKIIAVLLFPLLVMNNKTGWLFRIDEDNVFHRDIGVSILLALCLADVLASLAVVVIFRKKTKPASSRTIFYAAALVVAAALIQQVSPAMLMTGLAISLGCLIAYLNIQNPKDLMDPMTKAYSRNAFTDFCREALANHWNYPLVFIDIKNTSTFNKTFGEGNGNLMIKSVALTLMKLNRRNLVFRHAGDSFIIALRNRKSLAEIMDSISRLKDMSIELGGVIYDIRFHSFCFTQLGKMESLDDLSAVIEHSIEKCKQMQGEKTLMITRSIIDDARKNAKAEQALTNALENDELQLSFLPVYDVTARRFRFAKAIGSIDVPDLGLISQEELAAAAEKTGKTGLLLEKLLHKLLSYMDMAQSSGKSMFEAIGIPLHASDCLNPHLADEVLGIISKHKVKPSSIALEITETLASISPTLPENLRRLDEAGILLTCGNFGIGYANLDQITSLPFALVKVDHQIMTNGEKGFAVTSRILALLNELGYKTMLTGISNKAEAAMAIDAGAKYIQGSFAATIPLSSLT